MKKDEALSTLIVEGENLKRIFQHIQSWASDEDDIDNLLNDPERKEDIEDCLENINNALEVLNI